MEVEVPRPLPLLEITPERIHINVHVFHKVLDKIGDLPLVVYSINGETRSGKSFLLNYFIRYFELTKPKSLEEEDPTETHKSSWFKSLPSSAFKSSSGNERITVGIDLWSEPYFVNDKDVDGSEKRTAILLLDTQGLFDKKTAAWQNERIFSISTLLSSVMIFNHMQNINDDLLHKINTFSHNTYSSTSLSLNEDERAGNIKLKDVFQKLTFVLRDFVFEEYDFGLHSPVRKPEGIGNNFFCDTFQIKSDRPEENNSVRMNILNMYQSLDVYLLPDPGKKFKQRATNEEEKEPDEEFLENLKAFVEWITSPGNVVKKKIPGCIGFASGTSFKNYVSKVSNLYDTGQESISEKPTATENTAITHYSEAKLFAYAYYVQELYEQIYGANIRARSLEEIHFSCKNKAVSKYHEFKKIEINNTKFKQDFLESLENEIDSYFQNILISPPFQEDLGGKTFKFKTGAENDSEHHYDFAKELNIASNSFKPEKIISKTYAAIEDQYDKEEGNSKSKKEPLFRRITGEPDEDDNYESVFNSEHWTKFIITEEIEGKKYGEKRKFEIPPYIPIAGKSAPKSFSKVKQALDSTGLTTIYMESFEREKMTDAATNSCILSLVKPTKLEEIICPLVHRELFLNLFKNPREMSQTSAQSHSNLVQLCINNYAANLQQMLLEPVAHRGFAQVKELNLCHNSSLQGTLALFEKSAKSISKSEWERLKPALIRNTDAFFKLLCAENQDARYFVVQNAMKSLETDFKKLVEEKRQLENNGIDDFITEWTFKQVFEKCVYSTCDQLTHNLFVERCSVFTKEEMLVFKNLYLEWIAPLRKANRSMIEKAEKELMQDIRKLVGEFKKELSNSLGTTSYWSKVDFEKVRHTLSNKVFKEFGTKFATSLLLSNGFKILDRTLHSEFENFMTEAKERNAEFLKKFGESVSEAFQGWND